MARKAILLVLLWFPLWIYAYEKEAFIGYSKEELRGMNVQNLDDLLRRLPLYATFYHQLESQHNFGGTELRRIAIYKDRLPLFLDQNSQLSYQSISLADIDSVSLSSPALLADIKAQYGLIIHMYSAPIHKERSIVQLSMSNSSLGDWSANTTASFSNLKHSLGWHFGRYYENGLKEPGAERAMEWASSELHQIGVRYHLQFFESSSWELSYTTNFYHGVDRSPYH